MPTRVLLQVHRDLKPSNLLLNANCDLKICDFGLARALGPADDQSSFLTEYVATRWYRAPEVLLSWCRYTKALDMWSIGCIVAELLGRRAIFPGKDYRHQISLICSVLGPPTEEDLAGITSHKAKEYLMNMRKATRQSFDSLYPSGSEEAIELLNRLLVFNPDARFTVQDALESSFMASLHDNADEPCAPGPIQFDVELEGSGAGANAQHTTRELKRMMYNECRDHYHQYLSPWPHDSDGGDTMALEAAA